ncbi:MAG: antibiotic biosynthesis monooxygenase [Actinomycetota bacterium]|nr:antibiotic biosynthesis monooxygenase [Actinomycetota bacterium]
MAEPFIFINTYRIKPGQEEAYLEKFREVMDIVRDKEPKMLYFAEHISEDGSEATTVQVHANAENMAFHMQLIEDRIRAAGRYLDVDSYAIRIYGTPTPELLEQMRQLAGSGVSVTVSRPVAGFDRFPET